MLCLIEANKASSANQDQFVEVIKHSRLRDGGGCAISCHVGGKMWLFCKVVSE